MQDRWPRSARFDAPRIVDRLAAEHGVRLSIDGPCPGGEVGAAYVRWPDGRRSVLNSGSPHAGPLLDLARAAGLPVPRYELVTEVDGMTVVVQQRLPGAPPSTVDAGLVDQLAAVNDRFAGLLADRPDLPTPDLFLTADGPGFCLHEPLASFSPRSARLLDRIHEVGATAPPVTGDDLMHLDFHPGNALVEDGRLTGLIDWDGAARGDRHFDLVTLAFTLAGSNAPHLAARGAPHLAESNAADLAGSGAPHLVGSGAPRLAGSNALHLAGSGAPHLTRSDAPHLAGRLHDRLARIDEQRRRSYWAHMSLRQVDWSIRHHDNQAVDHWLTVAESGFRTGGLE